MIAPNSMLLVAATCALLLSPTVAQGEEAAQPASPLVGLSAARVVDLSWTYDEQTIYWPTSPSTFELKQLAHGHTEAGFFYASNSFCTPEHGGTHMDAPVHFAEKEPVDPAVPGTDGATLEDGERLIDPPGELAAS